MQNVSYASKTLNQDSLNRVKADSVKIYKKGFEKGVDSIKSVKKSPQVNVESDANKEIFVAVIVALSVICVAICIFIIYASSKSPKDKTFPLGLPDGSIRAIIAVLAIIFYILISVILSLSETSETSKIATDVTKTLGTLVVAVSAFYFGSKTAEQGSKTATDNLTKILDNQNQNSPNDIPISIIMQAITMNKDKWMGLYNCKDIITGKKKSQDTTHDLNCIVFVVSEKTDNPSASKVPQFITYNSQGKDYNIPTDVQTS